LVTANPFVHISKTFTGTVEEVAGYSKVGGNGGASFVVNLNMDDQLP
jgi:hypothetical protein